MRFRALFLLLALLPLTACTSCGSGLFPHLDGYESAGVRRSVESSIRVLVSCLNGSRGSGSGVAVSPRHVLTARHVVEMCGDDMPLILVMRHDGKIYEMAVDELTPGKWSQEAGDPKDMARLVRLGTDEPFSDYAHVATYTPRIGQKVCIVAGDGRFQTPFQHKCGTVAVVGPEIIRLDMHTVPGNSGGAVFDSEGRVIGIVVAGSWHPALEFFGVAIRPAIWPKLWEGLVYVRRG